MNNLLKQFGSISLSEMEEQMWSIGLDRMEKKYITHISNLENILKDLQNDYVALEIKGAREFGYHNIYFDTEEYKFFHEHGHGFKVRTKLRTRKYIDSKLAFFEYKQRDHDTIRKFKFDITLNKHGKFTKRCRLFTDKLYQSIYQTGLESQILPALVTEYTRSTLCSKNNNERITFDVGLHFTDARNKDAKPIYMSDIVLIESKSGNLSHQAEAILEKHGVVNMNWISKYCLGILLEGIQEKQYERFEKVLNYIDQIQSTN